MAEVEVQAGRDYDGKSAAEAAHRATGKQIIDLIKAKLTKGELKATALQPPSLARVEIPAGLWVSCVSGLREAVLNPTRTATNS